MSEAPQIDPAVLLARGVEIPVATFDGKQETAKVRILRVSEFQTFLAVNGDYERLAEFVTGNQPGWADSILPTSVMDIVEKAMDLNFDAACRWARRQADLLAIAKGLKPDSRKPSPLLSSSSAPTSA